MSIEQARISAMHLETEYPVESAVLKSEEAQALEDQGYQVWIATVFPDYFDCEFLPEHEQLWTWGWKFLIALRDRQTLPPDANAFLDLLSRNYGKSMHCEAFMAAAVCVVGYGIFLYVSGSQDLANEHLSNIEGLLTSQGVMQWYPEHSRPKKSQITGANRGWTQKKLMTDGGATVWAIGLLVGVRGIRKGKERVRGFVLDDVDDYDDSPQVALKKANTLASSVLPTSDTEFFVIGAQNLITEHSVFNRIYTKQDTMLAHRAIAGPLKAFENLETEFRDGRDMITGGVSNWPERVTPEVCQRFIDTYGLIRFMAEFQHDFSSNKQGLCFENYDDNVHVITKSEFFQVFGTREIPTRWWKYQFHDHARTKTAYHANVTGTVAVSSMNEKLPGFIFLFNLMSFPAQTEAEEVAMRILKGISPTVEVNHQKRLWDELVESSLHRAHLEQFTFDLTKLIRMRRATLAKIIPPLVPGLVAQKNYKGWRMSHEAINGPGRVYKEVYGLPFNACNPGADGGLELFNHYLKVDYSSAHPFGANENRTDGRGFSRTFIVVEDDELAYTADVSPERLHDAALCRYQFNHWRYTTPTLNDKGEKEWGPQKMNDDFGNGLMMLFHDNMPQAAPLNRNETIHEYLPVAIKDETINAQPQLTGEERGKLLTLQQLKMKQIAKQVDKKSTRNVIGSYRRFARGK
jgi:hypothetical protein